MGNEVKELLEPTKSTVMVRFELAKKVHKDCMSVHANNPNTMTFADSMADIVKEGVRAIKAKNRIDHQSTNQ
jgi:hypothetical protein